MNKIKMLISFFVITIFLNLGITEAANTQITSKNIHNYLNIAIQDLDIKKKNTVLNRLKTTPIIEDKLNGVFLNKYIYNNITKIKYSDLYINKNNNGSYLNFTMNKYSLLDPYLYNEKKEKIRDFLIKEMFDKGLIDLSEEMKLFDIHLGDEEGNYNVSRNNKSTNKKDTLSEYIDNILSKNIKNLEIISDDNNINIYYNYLKDNNLKKQNNYTIDLNTLKESLIIRDEKDLKKLFKLTSYRTRENIIYDKEYRQYNIKKVYDTVENNNFVLSPNQTLSFDYLYRKNDTVNGDKFKNGVAIVGGKEEQGVYGGGVCGAATGIYQGIIYNNNIEVIGRNHSWWYNGYNANINGEYIKTPGLDTTYYGGVVDMKLKNTSKYPIILVNKIRNNVEENFTLSLKYEENDRIESLDFIKQNDKCFTWKRGDKEISSCYNSVTY